MRNNCRVLDGRDDVVQGIAFKNVMINANGKCTRDIEETGLCFLTKRFSKRGFVNLCMNNPTNMITANNSKMNIKGSDNSVKFDF